MQAACTFEQSRLLQMCPARYPAATTRRHSLHAIAGQLSPAPGCTGIEVLHADTFNLHCFQTLTGTKFLMVVKPDTPDVDEVLRTL